LGASEHGNVTFKIKTKNTLVTGNSVSNKADIYFDYNFPVATNTVMTTFDTLGIDNPNLDNGISIYPNPTNGIVNIKADSDVISVELFDVRGRKLMENHKSLSIDLVGFDAGIYFVKVFTVNGSAVERLVKE
uniref:T9SS type A sorting domain-containing protein n=1 Tax=Flavobacterium sp. TaxID=239 RepID=UPI0026028FEF